MTPADRAAAVAAAERVLAYSVAYTSRAMVCPPDGDAPALARAILDLAATVERVEELCAAWEASGTHQLATRNLRATLGGEACLG